MRSPERILWQALRSGRLEGLKFRRQHPIGACYADFACPAARLVIELDGPVHERDDVAERDWLREQAIERAGWFVLRFSNAEVMRGVEPVVAAILRQVQIGGRRNPSPPAPLPSGEGRTSVGEPAWGAVSAATRR